MKKRTKIILDTLEEMYPDARCELNYETPFQLLVATILSAQTTDKKVNKVGRDNKILLCDGNEVLWCVGEFATRFKNRSGQFVRIRVESEM